VIPDPSRGTRVCNQMGAAMVDEVVIKGFGKE